jgi:hypothetical protein
VLLPVASPASTRTQQLVDEEVRRIVAGAETDVIELPDKSLGKGNGNEALRPLNRLDRGRLRRFTHSQKR